MNCPTCGNAHSDDCSVAALKASIERLDHRVGVLNTRERMVLDAMGYAEEEPGPGWDAIIAELLGIRERNARISRHTSAIARLFDSASPLPEDVRVLMPVGSTAVAKVGEVLLAVVAERDTLRAQLAGLRTYLTRSIADDLGGVDEAGDILNNLPAQDRAMVGAWTLEMSEPMYWSKEVAELRAQLADRQRLLDLVRHQRGPLHDAELISDEEYAALAGDHGAVARLEGYDEARERLAEVEATLLNERGEGTPPGDGWAFLVTRDLQGVWGTEQNGGMVQRTTARGWYWTDYETGFSPKNVHPTARAAMRAANAARKG